VARNRKRAKERRARRQAPVPSAHRALDDAAPEPLAHAAPDVELAEAQLALGRPDVARAPEPGREPADDGYDERDEAFNEQELEEEVQDSFDGGGDGRGGGGAGGLDGGAAGDRGGEQLPAAPARAHIGSRLINFIQGSWRELQRVQWPDRRQVIQATSVVIGFVIVAGVFLGVADYLAGHIMNYILDGHW
jgi:preprotein translocase subunit SecE